MIIVRLIGGLGNQMFQYALGRKLAIKNDSELKFDIDALVNHSGSGTPRQYALSIFDIQKRSSTVEEVRRLKNGENGTLALILQNFGFTKKRYSFMVEPHFNFAPEILEIKGDAYLQGYWQTEKYFKDIADELRKDFTLKNEFNIDEKEITKEIKNANAVSLHIRRGDYVSDATTGKFHGICSLEYYAEAVRCIAGKVDRPVFYIFSDDIGWVKENLKIDFPTRYVSDGILKDYEELTLMSYCRHNIIANSSFSWWGAWLNANPEKIVIAPKRWFADPSVDTSDIISEQWIRL